MRPIKFRGRALSDGRWVYGYYRFISESNTHQIIWGELLQAGADIDPDTLGQLTGLLDKNGKEIYEGDIIKVDGTKEYENCEPKPTPDEMIGIFEVETELTPGGLAVIFLEK